MTDDRKRTGPRLGTFSASGCAVGIMNLDGMMPRNEDGTIGPVRLPLYPLIEDIQKAISSKAYSAAILSAIVIPDACGAIEFPEDSNRARYSKWYDKYVSAIEDGEFKFYGSSAWRLRNGLIHETGLRFSEFGYDRVILVPPGGIEIQVGFMRKMGPANESDFVLGLEGFLDGIIMGAEAWLKDVQADEAKQDRLKTLIQLRPEGLPPYFIGVPVIY
ncbi:MAG: hypothetical protein ABIO68_04120 [Sphingomicrobium sp.]